MFLCNQAKQWCHALFLAAFEWKQQTQTFLQISTNVESQTVNQEPTHLACFHMFACFQIMFNTWIHGLSGASPYGLAGLCTVCRSISYSKLAFCFQFIILMWFIETCNQKWFYCLSGEGFHEMNSTRNHILSGYLLPKSPRIWRQLCTVYCSETQHLSLHKLMNCNPLGLCSCACVATFNAPLR